MALWIFFLCIDHLKKCNMRIPGKCLKKRRLDEHRSITLMMVIITSGTGLLPLFLVLCTSKSGANCHIFDLTWRDDCHWEHDASRTESQPQKHVLTGCYCKTVFQSVDYVVNLYVLTDGGFSQYVWCSDFKSVFQTDISGFHFCISVSYVVKVLF